MSTFIHAPAPVRPLKRKADQLGDLELFVSKQPRVSSPIHDSQESPYPRSSSSQSLPDRRGKGIKSPRLRARSAPCEDIEALWHHLGCPDTMKKPGTPSSHRQPATEPQIGAEDQRYPSVLEHNGIILDHTGRQKPTSIEEFVLGLEKKRDSPPLTQKEINVVLDVAERIADGNEAPGCEILTTPMVPLSYRENEMSWGGNSPWHRKPLPNDPVYPHQLSTPKPDRHYGYPIKNSWDAQQATVLDAAYLRPFARPTPRNYFPFLAIEAKAEASGGTLWVAQNQAAGSGSHMVNSIKQLLDEAQLTKDATVHHTGTEALSFTITLNQREAYIWINFIMDKKIVMSPVNSYQYWKPSDVQACHIAIKNLLDYCLDKRKATIVRALGELFPLPAHWNLSTATSEASTAVSEVDRSSYPTPESSTSSRKRQRQS